MGPGWRCGYGPAFKLIRTGWHGTCRWRLGTLYASLSGPSEPLPGDSLTSLVPPRAPVLRPRAARLACPLSRQSTQHGRHRRGRPSGWRDPRQPPGPLQSRRAFRAGPGDPGEGHVHSNALAACLASLCAGVVPFWGCVPGLSVRGCCPVLGCVPGWEALSSGSADAQSKKEWRPPTRGQCFIWQGVGAAGHAPPAPHTLRPSSVHGPRDGALMLGRVSAPGGGPVGAPASVCSSSRPAPQHAGLTPALRESLAALTGF